MADQPLILTPDQVLAAGIDSFVAARPQALKYINYGAGVYSHIFTGMRGQAAVALRRLALLAAASRLELSNGPDLLDLAAGEFDTDIDPTPRTAVGEITLNRASSTTSGVIRRGTPFNRIGNPTGVPLPSVSAQYTSTADVFVAVGQTAVTVTIEATRPGSFANHVWDGQTGLFSIGTKLFDTFTVATSGVPYRAAGGTDGPSDDYIRLAAKKYSVGQYAPVVRGVVAGMLLSGAAHIATIEDPNTGYIYAGILDQNWTISTPWINSVLSTFLDNDFLGFGVKVVPTIAGNSFIHVDATVVLRDASLLIGDTSDITAAIQTAAREYFDEREDWYTWSHNGLRGAISKAHPHILFCSSTTVKGAGGGTVLEPPAKLNVSLANSITHSYLADNSTTITYQAPN